VLSPAGHDAAVALATGHLEHWRGDTRWRAVKVLAELARGYKPPKAAPAEPKKKALFGGVLTPSETVQSTDDPIEDGDGEQEEEEWTPTFELVADEDVVKLGLVLPGVPPKTICVHSIEPGSWAHIQSEVEPRLAKGTQLLCLNGKPVQKLKDRKILQKLLRVRPLTLEFKSPEKKIPPKDPIPALVGCVLGEFLDVRRAALEALMDVAPVGHPEVIRAASKCLDDRMSEHRLMAAQLIAKVLPPGQSPEREHCTPALVARLKDEDKRVQALALQILS
jgi:hypothetical protein